MKKLLISLFALCSLALAALPASATAQAPESLIKDTTDKMIAALSQDKNAIKNDPARIYALVDDIVLPHFDFERMAKLVLAQNWKSATPAQQEAFVQEFRALLVRTYATSLSEYSDEQVEIQPVRGDPASRRVTVPTVVRKPSDPKFTVPIDYEMYQPADAWKVYNVTVDGVSLVTNYRNSFDDEIRKSGMDGLLQSLKNKTEAALKPGAK
jgi:phospholipid transport system substrate-binding protein